MLHNYWLWNKSYQTPELFHLGEMGKMLAKWRGYDLEMSKKCQVYTDSMPDIWPIFAWAMQWNCHTNAREMKGISQVWEGYGRDLGRICWGHDQDMAQTFPGYAQDMPKIGPWCAKDMPKIC